MKIWEILEHTADFAFRIFGKEQNELFQNARKAFYEAIFDEIPETENEAFQQEIKLQALDMSMLLIDWLRELLYLLVADHTIIQKVEIIQLTQTNFIANCSFLKIRQMQKEPFIKAITYHNSEILEKDGILIINVICDV